MLPQIRLLKRLGVTVSVAFEALSVCCVYFSQLASIPVWVTHAQLSPQTDLDQAGWESVLHTNDWLPPDNSIRMLELIMMSAQSALSARAPAAHGSGSSDLALGGVQVLVVGPRRWRGRVLGM
jgi:hypothetical protein